MTPYLIAESYYNSVKRYKFTVFLHPTTVLPIIIIHYYEDGYLPEAESLFIGKNDRADGTQVWVVLVLRESVLVIKS